jgi:hypothetical protein
MRNILFITALLVSGLSMGQAVTRANYQDDRSTSEKIEALQVAFLTQELGLTADEAQKFWPIYNDIKEDRDKLYKEKKRLMYDLAKNFEGVSETDAQGYVDRMFEIEGKLNESNFESRHRKIIKVIGPKRFLTLKKSEREFRVKLIQEYKGRNRGNTP